MNYLQLAYIHLGTVFPAFLIGTYLLISRKGNSWHKNLGKMYMLLMLITALITLLMPAEVGPTFLSHFGFIHLFSFFVFYSVSTAYLAIRKGNVKKHKTAMIGLYCGGVLIAGAFAFIPGGLLHGWLLA